METNPIPNSQPDPQYAPQPTAPKNNRTIIIVVVAIIALCCCCAAAIGGYYGYQAYVAGKQAVDSFKDFEIPDGAPSIPNMPGDSSDPDSSDTPAAPDFNFDQFAPKGGLGDDTTRITAWAIVQFSGILSGCSTPMVDDTTIAVTQQPDSSGVWREDWDVNCGDNTRKTFHLKFTPQDGSVNVEIE